tara:strand:+ start:780 stop:1205 length:426 start_codon:yes stop_codon:yes gene_type:complete
MELKRVHSSAIVLEDNGILIIGDSGSGKSDLALRLIDSGATLISDDITICEKKKNLIYLSAPLETRGLLEVREVGIITVPFVEGIILRMIVKLEDGGLERIPQKKNYKIFGQKIPMLTINGKNSSSVVKVKVKLNEIQDEK